MCFNDNNNKTISEPKEDQEPKVPESNQKQWQSKKRSKCVNQNPAASSNQWQIPEITRKVDTEVTFFSSHVTCHCSKCDDRVTYFLTLLTSYVPYLVE